MRLSTRPFRAPWKIALVVGFLGLAAASVPTVQAGKKSDSQVKVTTRAGKPDASGNQTITVTLAMNKGWHVYANPVGNEDLAPAATVVKVTSGAKLGDVKISYPKGKLVKDKTVGDYIVYENKVNIVATIQRTDSKAALDVAVTFNACNDTGVCLLPATLSFKVP
jgi:DsbC/DsbD-like thiol-disulfide interchange protein